jgi:bifunctional non-homologous end joining protein LigD
VELPSERGGPVSYVLVNDQDTLLYLVNQGALTLHVWFSRVHHFDRPDFVLFDLDPGDAPFTDVMVVAKQLHARLQAEAVASFVKTSGKTGLHVLVPWEDRGDSAEARDWARQQAQAVVAVLPVVATLAKPTAGGESLRMWCKTRAVTMRSPHMCCARCHRPASPPHWPGTS